jgi:hypothetical protein
MRGQKKACQLLKEFKQVNHTNCPNLGELKNGIRGGFWVNFPNPIYIVIILAKLKVH